MKLPNFFIIGAPKCGTTSLAQWLSEHKNIYFSPVKEPFYFSEDIHQIISSWNEYKGLFSDANDEHIAVGEGSTTYLFSQVAIKKIEEKFNNPLYIVMVRNPIDMAYSLHEQRIFTLLETVNDFETAWRLSPERRMMKNRLSGERSPLMLDYQETCLIGKQIERLYSQVPRDRVLILLLDDVKQSPKKEYEKVLKFLNVPFDDKKDFPVYNSAKHWRNRWQGKLIRDLAKTVGFFKYRRKILPKQSLGIVDWLKNKVVVQQKRLPMDDKLRCELRKFFTDDVEKLSVLLDRDLIKLWNFSPCSDDPHKD